MNITLVCTMHGFFWMMDSAKYKLYIQSKKELKIQWNEKIEQYLFRLEFKHLIYFATHKKFIKYVNIKKKLKLLEIVTGMLNSTMFLDGSFSFAIFIQEFHNSRMAILISKTAWCPPIDVFSIWIVSEIHQELHNVQMTGISCTMNWSGIIPCFRYWLLI